MVLVMIGLSAVLFVFAYDNNQGWLAVAKTISCTLAVILVWFMIRSPLFTKAIQKLLQKKESRYGEEVVETLSFLPVLRKLIPIIPVCSPKPFAIGIIPSKISTQSFGPLIKSRWYNHIVVAAKQVKSWF